MVVDLGTGSGRQVVRRARAHANTLFIGVDADARALADTSRRAARAQKKGGLPNTLFLAEGAEQLPGPLAGRANLVTIALPWGSLLRGLLSADTTLVAAITGCLRPDGEIEMLLSAVATDPATAGFTLGRATAAELAFAYSNLGLQVVDRRAAEGSDVARLSSGWGGRLGIPERRPAWVLRLRVRSDQ